VAIYLASISSKAGGTVLGRGVCLARIEQRQDVRVLEVGRGFDLGQESLGPRDRGQFGARLASTARRSMPPRTTWYQSASTPVMTMIRSPHL